nr:uncharacterized protein LOC111420700 [Onthophagus taurus]
MMGQHLSVMSLFKKDITCLYVMKCICDLFHLCASYACQKLPRFIEDLTRDIYNYFASSSKRISDFKEFQEFYEVKLHKILQPSQRRWLSVHFVVRRILEQFGALQLFFTDAVSKKDLLAAENILHKLNDPTTKLFLQFLDFVLPFFNSLNREMQAERPKLHLLYRNICNILKAIFDCFIKHPLEVKSGSIPSISDVAILFPNLIDESMLQPLDNEWRLLRNNNEILAFPDDVFLFWNEVTKIDIHPQTLKGCFPK